MRKIFTLAVLVGLLAGLTGCNDEEAKKEANRKAKRDQMKQPINSKSNNEPTKLPF